MIEILNNLSDALEKEANLLLEFINNGTAYESEIFSNPVMFSPLDDRPYAIRGLFGVYAFVFASDDSITRDEVVRWNSIKGAGFKLWKDQDIMQGDVLYVGSCSSNSLYTRMGQHLSESGEHTSLKLKNEKRNKFNSNLTIYAFPLNKCVDERFSRIVLTTIEKILHDCLTPLAGSSKV